mgnify:CR=1 FL=1
MISPEDQVLIDRSLAGHRSAQGELYRKYAKAMYHIAARMVPERQLATDLTQDVFVKVFEELKRFRGESTLGAWIKRITINTCLNHLKKAGRLREDELNEGLLLIPDEEDRISKDVDMKSIHNAIKELPDGSRTVLNLYLLEGYRHKEIAEIMGITESTSKTQYRRGKILLQDKLKAVYYNED